MKNIIDNISRKVVWRIIALSFVYGMLFIISLWFSYLFRFDFFQNDPEKYSVLLNEFGLLLILIVPLKLLVLTLTGQYSRLISYISIPDLLKVVASVVVPSVILLLFLVIRPTNLGLSIPRGVVLIDLILSFGVVLFVRLFLRLLRERITKPEYGGKSGIRRRKLAIIGAGSSGSQLIRELSKNQASDLEPIAVFDDDATKWNTTLHGVPVYGAPEQALDMSKPLGLEVVALAIPTAQFKRKAEIACMLNQGDFKLTIVPSISQIASGSIQISQLKKVDIEDLLGRPPVTISGANIQRFIGGATCLVTGGGGSIGSELCRQILRLNPKKLLIIERCEVQMFQIERELVDSGFENLECLICDILDEKGMNSIFRKYRPEIVFHAAAHKHVPLMESQPAEAVKNNLLGTKVLADVARLNSAGHFIMISTDKAINPTNVMGATKRAAELYLQSLTQHTDKDNKTRFIAVRFGNVLGSSGSVIPTFKEQIAKGGPVKVTHKDVTRYFMTIPEACSLVLEAGTLGQGGEIFVLDMGAPVKIVDLAKKLIALSGLKVGEDIAIEFVGLRPGEKMFEELQHDGENMKPTSHHKIMKFIAPPSSFGQAEGMVEDLSRQLDIENSDLIREKLKQYIPEYSPYSASQQDSQ